MRGRHFPMGTMGRQIQRFVRIVAEICVIWLVLVDLVELTRSTALLGIACDREGSLPLEVKGPWVASFSDCFWRLAVV